MPLARERLLSIRDGLLRDHRLPALADATALCDAVMDALVCEPNIRRVSSPAVVVGDLHGQFHDLLHLLTLEGPPSETLAYVFLGDYVDRGEHSLECVLLLFAFKALLPAQVTLLRGNHELKAINRVYGFYDETVLRYGNSTLWHRVNEAFDYLNIACVIDRRYFCVHGGISPRLTLPRLERLDRFEAGRSSRAARADPPRPAVRPGSPAPRDAAGADPPDEAILADALWSDPYYKPGTSANPRGSGCPFGEDILIDFLTASNTDILIRSHQLALEGFKWNFTGLCLTVWSAPNYMGKCTNPACVLLILPGEDITNRSLRLFKKTRCKV